MKSKTQDAISVTQKSGCGSIYVIMSHDKGILKRIHISLGKSGSCASTHLLALQDLINKLIELGCLSEDIVKSIYGHTCHKGNCCINHVATSLEYFISMFPKEGG